tara:strand:+ start:1502 stop:2614 length:1113 start_codon:yes stop_codon:yes gene_type:complete
MSASSSTTPSVLPLKFLAKKIKENGVLNHKGFTGISLYNKKIQEVSYDNLKSHRGKSVALAVVKTGLGTSSVCLLEEETNRAGTKHFGYTIGRKKFPTDDFMKGVCCASAKVKSPLITDLPGYFNKKSKSGSGSFTAGQYYNNATIGWVEGVNATDETQKLAIKFIKNSGYDASIVALSDGVVRQSNGTKKRNSAIEGFSRSHQKFYDNYTCSFEAAGDGVGDEWSFKKKEGGVFEFDADDVAYATLILTAYCVEEGCDVDMGENTEKLANMLALRKVEIEKQEASSGANKKILAKLRRKIADYKEDEEWCDRIKNKLIAKYGEAIVVKAEGGTIEEVAIAEVDEAFSGEESSLDEPTSEEEVVSAEDDE